MGLTRLNAYYTLDILLGGLGVGTCRDGLIGPESSEVTLWAMKVGLFLVEGLLAVGMAALFARIDANMFADLASNLSTLGLPPPFRQLHISRWSSHSFCRNYFYNLVLIFIVVDFSFSTLDMLLTNILIF